MLEEEKQFSAKLLMLTTLIISGCSIIYEVLISSVSSYLVGDSIKQFSITIGLYMSAMGLGSYLSKYIKKNLFDFFVSVEIGVGIFGGLSALTLFMSYVKIENYNLVMYIQIILIGILVGLEIPLLTRIIEENNPNLRVTLSTLFSFDYIGGLIGSVAFPLILLPEMGYFATSFLTGCLNILVAFIIVWQYKRYIVKYNFFKMVSILSFIVLLLGAVFSENLAKNVEGNLYRDRVVYSQQTPYQNIVVTKHKDDLRLFIDGNLQFSTADEYRYHESLVHIPMLAAPNKQRILVLGGGDGLAVREILKYDEVENIVMVDLDPEIVELCRSHEAIRTVNEGALDSEKLRIVNEDAYKYLEETDELFDVVIIDLPDPNNESLNKLYSNVFYRLVKNHLAPEAVMSIQSTSPYYAPKAFWCINKTLEAEGLNVMPYHAQVPTFGDWGFQLASNDKINIEQIKTNFSQNNLVTRFLNLDTIERLFVFSEDERVDKSSLEINSLLTPKLLTYYLDAVKEWR